MKIATGIIGLMLGLLVFLQSCVVTAGSNLANDQSTMQAGSVGILVGLVFFIGGAFAFALPKAAMVIFALASGLAFLASMTGSFGDMNVWGFAAMILATMSFFSSRKKPISDSVTTND
ncbi:MAG: hypothetical protein OIF58_01350 [Cohaesibacter sp.]|nr:hypothetical protein [Cohaesibacter sp.]